MVGWRTDERDAGDAVARLGNHLVDFKSGQLSALTGLGTLCHLDLYLLSIHQVFRCNAETTRCHLFRLAVQTDAVESGVETFGILATLTRIRACTEFVHGKTDGFVRLFA